MFILEVPSRLERRAGEARGGRLCAGRVSTGWMVLGPPSAVSGTLSRPTGHLRFPCALGVAESV